MSHKSPQSTSHSLLIQFLKIKTIRAGIRLPKKPTSSNVLTELCLLWCGRVDFYWLGDNNFLELMVSAEKII